MTTTALIAQPKIDITRRMRRKMRSVMFWLKAKEDEVLSLFASLPRAVRVGSGDEQYVYIPGTRDDKVLLVAHADTVFTEREKDINPIYSNGVYSSGTKGIGIGADDRAGCAILWRLRDSGHSLLIPNREESGCKGSRFLMSDKAMADEINKHQFAIQFDRRGNNDLVFYDVGSQEFIKWCESQFVGYKHSSGSSTDIRHLCRDMCGVNISTGYQGEHWEAEKLVIEDWEKTLNIARSVLLQNNIPRFEKPKYVHPAERSWCRQDDDEQSSAYYRQQHLPRRPQSPMHNGPSVVMSHGSDSVLKCPHCHGLQDESEWRFNDKHCIFNDCKKVF